LAERQEPGGEHEFALLTEWPLMGLRGLSLHRSIVALGVDFVVRLKVRRMAGIGALPPPPG
jgi:hypothetical protein